jgi:hypothetical protein|tara:strand:+ start:418 stop:591 length:174 start_codon:yes stop_codon:yes gene_type:complete
MAKRVKFTVEFSADLDTVPGVNHNPEDWHNLVMREILRQTHYNTAAKVVANTVTDIT